MSNERHGNGRYRPEEEIIEPIVGGADSKGIYDDWAEEFRKTDAYKLNVEILALEDRVYNLEEQLKCDWRPVSDKPEDGQDCWTYYASVKYADWESPSYVMLSRYFDDEYGFQDESHGGGEITMWMPAQIPEKPLA